SPRAAVSEWRTWAQESLFKQPSLVVATRTFGIRPLARLREAMKQRVEPLPAGRIIMTEPGAGLPGETAGGLVVSRRRQRAERIHEDVREHIRGGGRGRARRRIGRLAHQPPASLM